ncbi:MAG TPA: hypothetical protein PL074_09175 [Thermoflexales bacterium]|nr:hypothetical protein [Thermoflexales bacterium]
MSDAASNAAGNVAGAASGAASNVADAASGAAKGAANAMNNAAASVSSADNTNLMSALAYLFMPFSGILFLLLGSTNNNAVLRKNTIQSIAFGVVVFVASAVLAVVGIGFCISILSIIPAIIWTIQAYGGKDVNIPVITDFCKKQGWF